MTVGKPLRSNGLPSLNLKHHNPKLRNVIEPRGPWTAGGMIPSKPESYY